MRMNQELGRRYPAYAGATGQVLLALDDPERLAAYLKEVKVEPLTSSTIRSTAALGTRLDRIKEAGVGISLGQRVPEAVAISAPVFHRHGLLYAITISGVASRWDAERALVAARAVKEAAEMISREAGYRPAEDEPLAADLSDPESGPAMRLCEFCKEIWPDE